MTTRRDLKMIVLTQLDTDKMHNTVEEQHARRYAHMGCAVTFLFKVLNQSSRFWDMVVDTCALRIRRRTDDDFHRIAIDPPFNYFAGYRKNAETQASSSVKRRLSLRLVVIRLLSPLSVLRDLFFVPCFVLTALTSTRGPWDVCVGFGPWGGLAAWVLYKLGRAKLLVYQDRDFEPGLVPDRLRYAYTAAIERFVIRRADLVCSVGHLLADLRRRESGRTVHVIPNGVDWEKFAPARDSTPTGHNLIYVGNVVNWGGLEHAIRAMPRIRESYADARLLVVGDGLPAYMDQLREMVEGLTASVEFLGAKKPDELPSLLARARIGLANSEPVAFRKYACPLKVIEYMAAGLAVITTEDTEAAAMLDRYACGLSIPYETAAFADCVVGLFDDNDRLQSMRESGIRASADMTWDKLVAEEHALITALGAC